MFAVILTGCSKPTDGGFCKEHRCYSESQGTDPMKKTPCKPEWDYVAGKCTVIVLGPVESKKPQIACHFVESEYKTLCMYDPKDPPK